MAPTKKRKLTETTATNDGIQSGSEFMETEKDVNSPPAQQAEVQPKGINDGEEVSDPAAADVTVKTKERQDRFKALQARAVSLLRRHARTSDPRDCTASQ